MTPPVFTTFHGWEGKYPVPLKSKLMRKLARVMGDGTIAVGEYTDIWHGTVSEKVIYGATDQKPLPMPSKPSILVFGRLSRDNDMEMVLEALERVKRMKKDLKITFLGDGEYRNRAKKLGKVAGFDPSPEKYLKQANVVITSSYLAILDSLAAGRQVVSVFGNPLKEDYLKLSPMTHLLHIAGGVQDLVKAIEKNVDKLKPNKKGSNWAREQTWEKVAEEYEDLWLSLG
jgi:glycosyltransferase involved in cell wall biosynthesis